jgi:excinuclease UvrABC nuclease subunit
MTTTCRPHRDPSIRKKPGLYAFVVANKVQYIGRAEILHRRLRNYSNRSFGSLRVMRVVPSPRKLKPRCCHTQIVKVVKSCGTVEVFAKVVGDASALCALEDSLIRKFTPPWNRTHGIIP